MSIAVAKPRSRPAPSQPRLPAEMLEVDSEPNFDDIARLAAQICGAPIAAITLVGDGRQSVKGVFGVERAKIPRKNSLSEFALRHAGLTVVTDAAADPRFARCVAGREGFRFYAGMPLHLDGGPNVGMLSVYDRAPRGLSRDQVESLHALSRQVYQNVKLNQAVRELEKAAEERATVEQALRASETCFETFMNNAPALALIKDAEGRFLYVNQLCIKYFDLPEAAWLGRTDEELFGEAVAAPWRTHDRRVLAEGRLIVTEEDVPTASGPQTWITHKFPIRSADGAVALGMLAVDITVRKGAEREGERLVIEWQKALAAVKTLSGLLPICCTCKNIRNDEGYWQLIEAYLGEHSNAEFTHGICPECIRKHYPEYAATLRPAKPPSE